MRQIYGDRNTYLPTKSNLKSFILMYIKDTFMHTDMIIRYWKAFKELMELCNFVENIYNGYNIGYMYF